MNVLLTDPTDEELNEFCLEEILQPDTPDDWILMGTASTWPDILVRVGLFKSKGQAKKNWKHGVEVTPGFHLHTVGKLRTELAVHKIIKGG